MLVGPKQRSRLKQFVFFLMRDLAHKAPIRRPLLHRYEYMFSPGQLAFLCAEIERVSEVPGVLVEIGCASGHTTVFLNKHLDALKMERDYVCIDTFAGFADDDVAFEQTVRKKAYRYNSFSYNRRSWFENTLRINDVSRVSIMEGDVKKIDLSSLGPVAFCLLDVDLYQPIRKALGELWPLLSPGGVIVVDDCRPGGPFDGARQAYLEFVEEEGLETQIVHGKLGVVRKPSP